MCLALENEREDNTLLLITFYSLQYLIFIFLEEINTECSKISAEAVCKRCKVHNEMAQLKSIEAAGCDGCAKYAEHMQRKIKSRHCYDQDKMPSEKSTDGKTCFYSLDLQKLRMLPEMTGVKSVVFTQQICACNESFSLIGERKGK